MGDKRINQTFGLSIKEGVDTTKLSSDDKIDLSIQYDADHSIKS
jgi:hypothetical protein